MARATRIRTGNSMTRMEGFNEVIEQLERLKNTVPGQYETFLDTISQKIKVDVQQRINNVSGDLKSSVRKTKKTQGDTTTYEVSAGGQKAPHAHLVEFGHRQVNKDGTVVGDVPARPFLRPAFENNKDEIISEINRIIDRAIRG